MRRRHLPRTWLLTDPRQSDALWVALERLPRGAGVVVRPYGLGRADREMLVARVRAVARRRGLMLVLAGDAREAARLKADGVYQAPARGHDLVVLATAHDGAELVAAARTRADLVLLSPVFPTRSHPGGRTLGPLRFGLLARRSRVPVIALGGMTAGRWQRLRPLGAYGWAGIDGWIRI
jgi:thiamine-phosphate pyrophosphorylase